MRFKLALAIVFLAMNNGGADALPSAVEVSELINRIGSAANTPIIDIAVTTSSGFCYAGRFERGSGVTPATIDDKEVPRFHSASISKLFTAVTIMQLRDEGKISLGDLVGEYVPAFRESPIRLEHLLTHTSGLRDRKRANGRSTRNEVDAYINSLAKQRIPKEPGTHWRYADAGFNLLGRVIENVTGRPFSDALRDRLLHALEMQDSTFDIAQTPMGSRVIGFNKRGKQMKHPWDMAFLPSSGLQTNARDLGKFARMVLSVNVGTDSHNVLSLETLQEMTTVRIASKWHGIGQGYAWQIAESKTGPVWRHAGGEAGYESLLAIYPKNGMGIVALGNQKDWPRFQLVSQIRDIITNSNTDLCTL